LQTIAHSGLKRTPHYTPASWKEEYRELHQRIIRDIYPMLKPSVQAEITHEFKRFHETVLNFKPVLCHRDLSLEHILESGDVITGVIDWGDSCIGDPAFDITGLLMGLGEEVTRNISDNLDFPPDYLERARFYSGISPFYKCLYGYDIGDEKHIKTGLEIINTNFT
jgi:aminoglycoside 2''-phosphotransferase